MKRSLFLAVILFLFLILGNTCVEAQSKNSSVSGQKICKKQIEVVELEYELPVYETKSNSELRSLCKNKEALGCTKINITPKLKKEGCPILPVFRVSYIIYVTNDYAKGSCEYEAIKKHENYHVKAYTFLKTDVKEYLNQCIIQEIKDNENKIYFNCIQKTIDWMLSNKKERNRLIDTYKIYDPTYHSYCKNWKMSKEEIDAHLRGLK